MVSQDAAEIGGDYYDVVHTAEDIYKVALGDVSGKGTTAAFYMAETKGIFQALTHLDMTVSEFIISANRALAQCFSKGSFMTLTYLHIDMKNKMVELLRAGHCPTLYYSAGTDKLNSLSTGSIGLGIIRDETFKDYLTETDKFNFESGDLLILFTDGIIEARNPAKEEFGMDQAK